MAVTASWADEARTIIRLFAGDPWSWEELIYAAHQAHGMIETIGHEVAVIYDFTATSIVPAGDAFGYLSKVAAARHDHEKLTVLVDVDTELGKAITRVYSAVYYEVQLADTLAAAYALARGEKPDTGQEGQDG